MFGRFCTALPCRHDWAANSVDVSLLGVLFNYSMSNSRLQGYLLRRQRRLASLPGPPAKLVFLPSHHQLSPPFYLGYSAPTPARRPQRRRLGRSLSSCRPGCLPPPYRPRSPSPPGYCSPSSPTPSPASPASQLEHTVQSSSIASDTLAATVSINQ